MKLCKKVASCKRVNPCKSEAVLKYRTVLKCHSVVKCHSVLKFNSVLKCRCAILTPTLKYYFVLVENTRNTQFNNTFSAFFWCFLLMFKWSGWGMFWTSVKIWLTFVFKENFVKLLNIATSHVRQGSVSFYEERVRFTEKNYLQAWLKENFPLRAIVFLKKIILE